MLNSIKTSTQKTTTPPTKSTAKTLGKPAVKPTSLPIAKEVAKPLSKPAPTAVKPVLAKIPVKTSSPKVVTKPVTKPATKPVTKNLFEKPIKAKKIKLVRDSFTIPKPEYLMLDNLKLRATDLKHPVKKGELIRAGIKALAAMTDSYLLAALKAVPMLKTGRPSK